MHVQFKDAARFEISFTARKPNVSGEAAASANVEGRLGHAILVAYGNEMSPVFLLQTALDLALHSFGINPLAEARRAVLQDHAIKAPWLDESFDENVRVEEYSAHQPLCSATMQDRSRCCPDETVKRYVSTIRYPNRELSPFASRWTASVIQEAGRYRSRFCNDRSALGPVDSCITLDLMNRPTEVGGIRRTCHQFINRSLETPFATSHIMLVLKAHPETERRSKELAGGMTMFIRDVIQDREPYSLRASASVLEAAEFMAERKIGAVCVLNDEGKLIGVFSERDLLSRVVVLRRDAAAIRLGEVISELRAVIRCDETPHQALERMEKIGSRHLPVVDGEKFVGMLSIRDLLRVQLSEQGDELKLLHEYISQ